MCVYVCGGVCEHERREHKATGGEWTMVRSPSDEAYLDALDEGAVERDVAQEGRAQNHLESNEGRKGHKGERVVGLQPRPVHAVGSRHQQRTSAMVKRESGPFLRMPSTMPR